MKKRVIFLAMLMGAVLASGCGSQGKQDNTPANTVEVLKESSDGHENEITGVVKEISDSQITLIIGETDRSGGDGDAGNRVDKENAGRRPKETGNGSKTEGGDSKADESSGSDGGDAKEGADSGPNRAGRD